MKRNICNLVLKNKKVLIRADLNVPLKPNGEPLSTERITASLPTIVRSLYAGAKVIILSHLGRVKSEKDKEKLSLFYVGRELHRQLEFVLQKKVNFFFSPFSSGPEVEVSVEALKSGEILLLENTRFEDLNNKAESGNSLELANRFANLANVYINDAFGTAHRAHASNVGVAKLVSKRGFGFLVAKEIERLSVLTEKPVSPYVVIVGGAKVADKFSLLVSLLKRVDFLLVGGGIAYTFMAAIGRKIGGSIYEESMLKKARSLYKKYKDKIIMPVDFTCAKKIGDEPKHLKHIPDNLSAFDLGPKTVELFKKYISEAKTIFWNGPLGVYESPDFAVATNEIAKFIAQNKKAYKVIGGGDSAAAVSPFSEQIDHVSTGGGASLAFLEETPLPGVAVIQDCNDKCRQYCDDPNWLAHIKEVEDKIDQIKRNPQILKNKEDTEAVNKELKKDIAKILEKKEKVVNTKKKKQTKITKEIKAKKVLVADSSNFMKSETDGEILEPKTRKAQEKNTKKQKKDTAPKAKKAAKSIKKTSAKKKINSNDVIERRKLDVEDRGLELSLAKEEILKKEEPEKKTSFFAKLFKRRK